MYFFAVIFIILIIIFVNIYSKRDPITRDKVLHKRSFDRELAEQNEAFYMTTEITNRSFHPMGRIYIKHTLDNAFTLVNENKYKVVSTPERKHIICKTHVRAKRTREVKTCFAISRRGLYRTYEINIDCLDFLGFYTSYYKKKDSASIVILPKRVSNAFMSKMIAAGYGDFNAKRSLIHDESTIRAYAEYTGHEPMRHINWKKSAQAGEFIVKQFEPMGSHITTIVFDASNYRNMDINSYGSKLFEYAISMLREIFEYFEAKRISYAFYTNAQSRYIRENRFISIPSGKKTRFEMLYMLGELNTDFSKNKRMLNSNELLNVAINNSGRVPFIYLAPSSVTKLNASLKKISKIKGIEITELYAENYYKEEGKR